MSTDTTNNDTERALEIMREQAGREIAAIESDLRAVMIARVGRLAEEERYRNELEAIMSRETYALMRDAERRHAERLEEIARAEADAGEAAKARASVMLTEGASIEAGGLRIKATKGRVKWDDKGLSRAIAQPAYAWLAQYRSIGAPVLKIETVAGSGLPIAAEPAGADPQSAEDWSASPYVQGF